MEAKEEGKKMAQTTKSSSSRSTRSRSSSNRSTSRNGSSKPSRSRSSGSSRSRNGTSRTRQAQRRTTTNGPVAKTGEKVAELASKATKAAPQTDTVRRTGKKVGDFASKAKTPLVAGGAALAGIAGGVALKSRTENRRPIGKLKTRRLPQSLKNIDLGKVDLDAIMDAAKRVRSLGEQVGDVADAAEKTRKKHN
jgi:hypothetical protein